MSKQFSFSVSEGDFSGVSTRTTFTAYEFGGDRGKFERQVTRSTPVLDDNGARVDWNIEYLEREETNTNQLGDALDLFLEAVAGVPEMDTFNGAMIREAIEDFRDSYYKANEVEE